MRRIGSDEENSNHEMAVRDVGVSPGVTVGQRWEAVGPFPSGMREHPLTGPPLAAFLDPLSDPAVDFARRKVSSTDMWPSELAFGGRVGWDAFETAADGWTEVVYPSINWDQLRSDHGWASLQFESCLRTSLNVPQNGSALTPLLIDVVQGVEYAFVPATGPVSDPIKWYLGDVYAFADTQQGTRQASENGSNFARSLALVPGEYVLLVRALYEVRMFGDPGPSRPPTIRFRVSIAVDEGSDLEVVQGLTEVPDVVDGLFMGDWMTLAVRRPDGNSREVFEVRDISITIAREELPCEVLGPVTVCQGQTRPLAIRLPDPGRKIPGSVASMDITVRYAVNQITAPAITFSVALRQLYTSTQPLSPFKMTFPAPNLPPSGHPAYIAFAMVVPPPDICEPSETTPLSPVILATHGAGVDTTSPFWTGSMPIRAGGWAVLPVGKNEWGEDWHGGSMSDAWAARDVLPAIVRRLGVNVSDETLLVGHSNGGQGAWHLAARYPDRIVGVIVAAGYLKIQDYVPYIKMTSLHYADPALIGILMSSLTSYNNDLYSSNLAHIPVLAIHGAADGNVPPRHGRAQVGLISAWEGQHAHFSMLEVPGKDHWWDEVFRQPAVGDWIRTVQSQKKRTWDEDRKEGFTLTTANPDESGGRAGIRIVELDTPGRLARLDVNARQWVGERKGDGLDLRGMNVKRIEVVSGGNATTMGSTREHGFVTEAESSVPHPPAPIRAYGPMLRLLATCGPITFVVGANALHGDIAKRLVHDLFVYHRIATRIMTAMEALGHTARRTLGEGSVVVFGRPEENDYAKWLLGERKIPVEFPAKGIMTVEERLVYEQSTAFTTIGIISLHPHPTCPKSLACIIAGNDDAGLELAARLFPIRTGVPIPDWVVVGPRSRWMGAAGFVGAGFWNGEWKWSEGMSWMDR